MDEPNGRTILWMKHIVESDFSERETTRNQQNSTKQYPALNSNR